MIGRRAPALSSIILFVDDDFARLTADPPKVIVLGPSYNMYWQGAFQGDGKRTGPLIGLVFFQLLPKRYVLTEEVPLVRYDGSSDSLTIDRLCRYAAFGR